MCARFVGAEKARNGQSTETFDYLRRLDIQSSVYRHVSMHSYRGCVPFGVMESSLVWFRGGVCGVKSGAILVEVDIGW